MFSRLLLTNQNLLLEALYQIKINEKLGLLILLDKWLLNMDYFQDKRLRNLICISLSNLLKSRNNLLEKIFLINNQNDNYQLAVNYNNLKDNAFVRILSCLIEALNNEIYQEEEISIPDNNQFDNNNLNFSNKEKNEENQIIANEDDVNIDDLDINDSISYDFNLKVK